jgi:hypothetical protein
MSVKLEEATPYNVSVGDLISPNEYFGLGPHLYVNRWYKVKKVKAYRELTFVVFEKCTQGNNCEKCVRVGWDIEGKFLVKIKPLTPEELKSVLSLPDVESVSPEILAMFGE